MAVSDKERGVEHRGVSKRDAGAPDWAKEPPVWGDLPTPQSVAKMLADLYRTRVYRFAYPDGSTYDIRLDGDERKAQAWASVVGHRYLREVKREPPPQAVPRDFGTRGTEPVEPPFSAPPLVQAEPTQSKPPTRKKKPAPAPKKLGLKPVPLEPKQTPPPPVEENPIEQLKRVRGELTALIPELKKTGQRAKSESLDKIPLIGWAASAIYDVFMGDPAQAAESLAEEGLKEGIERLIPAADAPITAIDTWKWHKAMIEHGENVKKMEELLRRQYRLMDKLGMKEARYDLPGGRYYLGPGGLMYDKRTGRPVPRIQQRNPVGSPPREPSPGPGFKY